LEAPEERASAQQNLNPFYQIAAALETHLSTRDFHFSYTSSEPVAMIATNLGFRHAFTAFRLASHL